ncbi:MAG: Na+-transporting NADH:ubiquinone oxidoreductase subunit D [Bacteroidia bacterium]|nr:MAG: Na+-transporting NADH:ubiquinone oxidoreductase subunit D [Bacteroidia bacterium]
MTDKFIVSPSPHQAGTNSVKKLMYGVLIALLPAFLVSVYYFGWGALIVSLTTVASCVFFEEIITVFILKRKSTIRDGSAALTGLLLAFNLPSNIPIPLIVIGSLAAIGIGKMTFGGLGNNPFNPALVGRFILFISWPKHMSSWPKPSPLFEKFLGYTDITTGATPLGVLAETARNGESVAVLSEKYPSYMEFLIGYMGGSVGEVAAGALILGLIYMLWKKIITWHIPISILGTVTIMTGILWMVDPTKYANPLFHLLTGGLMLGAIFMATDYVTSPMSKAGMLVYGAGIGILTVVIRIWGSFPEGISSAILIMNACVPLINMYIKPKRFGEKVKK